MTNLVDEGNTYRGFLQSLRETLESNPDEVLQTSMLAEGNEASTIQAPSAISSIVFIVHGHDELDLLRLKELLRDKLRRYAIVGCGSSDRR